MRASMSLHLLQKEPIEIQLTCRSRVKKLAFDNAFTLIFMSAFFGITWIVQIVVCYGLHRGIFN